MESGPPPRRDTEGKNMQTTDSDRAAIAADHLRELLCLPEERPGSWEAEHVAALGDELREILEALDVETD